MQWEYDEMEETSEILLLENEAEIVLVNQLLEEETEIVLVNQLLEEEAEIVMVNQLLDEKEAKEIVVVEK